jgi:hypothetical protein
VDRIGVWFTETYEVRFPEPGQDQDRVEEATIEVYVRNASDLRVEVALLAYEVRTVWKIPEDTQSPTPAYVATVGNGSMQLFWSRVRVPPGETLRHPYQVNVAHLAPEGAVNSLRLKV